MSIFLHDIQAASNNLLKNTDKFFMRRAKSYSIIDHHLLHGGYFQRLSHKSLVLYLFLVVVGDRDGKSYYFDNTIMEILCLSYEDLNIARSHLERENLIDYRKPYWYVKNIIRGNENIRRQSVPRKPVQKLETPDRDLEYGKQRIQEILKLVSNKCSI